MKVNTQCVLKYLKHDYKEMGQIAALIVGAILVIAALGWTYRNSIWNGYMVLNVISSLTILFFTVVIAACDKTLFNGWQTLDEVSGTVGTKFFVTVAFIFGFMEYGFYTVFNACSSFKWEDPTLSVAIFVTLILIGTPIGCAIARCKEE